MNTLIALFLFMATAGSLPGQTRPMLEVVPLFTNLGFGPAFMLTCVNDGKQPVHLFDLNISVRLDGTVVQPQGSAGSGGNPAVAQGDIVRVMFMLHQAPFRFTKSPDFGALLRSGLPASMKPGLHSVEFQCLGRSSGPISLYWENIQPAK